MRWQRTTAKDKTIWVAVDENGNRIKGADGKFTVRYDSVGGCAYYTASRATLDKNASPEELPDGWPADSPQGFIARYCYGAEALKDWAFLDEWKRRRNTSLTHAGCGESGWTSVPLSSPLTCPRCGVLQGNEVLYAQWHTVKDPNSEGIRACVLDAWITGKRHEYVAGKREVPPKNRASRKYPAPTSTTPVDLTPLLDAEVEIPRKSPIRKILALLVFAVVAYMYFAR